MVKVWVLLVSSVEYYLMSNFKLVSDLQPSGDQKQAIRKLLRGIEAGQKYQVLLGVTGSGKTFTIANVIEKLQMPTLVISHNKTLAGQLYQELRDFFPENAVSYFVSYYDYYQPEAYIPSTDTYIEKEADINELIDKLRLQATSNILSRKDTIVVASVSSIYNIGSPQEYRNFVLEFKAGGHINRNSLFERLAEMQYERGDFTFVRGSYRVRGEVIDIFPAYMDNAIRVEFRGELINEISEIDSVSGKTISERPFEQFFLYPAKHYLTDSYKNEDIFDEIRSDLKKQVKMFKARNKFLEAQRLQQRVTYDLEMIKEVGYVNGIENYSRYFDGRNPGEAPHTLLDYFKESAGDGWLVIVDESHMTFPQIRGMYEGDLSRKKVLIDHGFRLPAALDNRPLNFSEFMERIPRFIATSATPADWERNLAAQNYKYLVKRNEDLEGLIEKNGLVQQLVRPTGIPDPLVEIRPTSSQVADVAREIQKRAKNKERTLVTTLTKRTAEDLSSFLKGKGLRVHYLHSDIQTLERADILDNLRRGEYDALIGINLLREGLDLPEVSLVAILDADKEGFLRSDTSLIQTMGRAARHVRGCVILYADNVTDSMKRALREVERRRKYQLNYNKKHRITPTQIAKPIRQKLIEAQEDGDLFSRLEKQKTAFKLPDIDVDELTPLDKRRLVRRLTREMKIAARELNFEFAAEIRDKIKEIEES